MKAITKRMVTLAMSLLCASSLAASASAEDIYEVYGNESAIVDTTNRWSAADSASVWGIKVPTSLWNLSNSNIYEGGTETPLFYNKYINTSYYFKTTSSKIDIDFTLQAYENYTLTRAVRFELYRRPINSGSWTNIQNYTLYFFPDEDDEEKEFVSDHSFTNLSSDYYYYIKIVNASPYDNSEADHSKYSITCDFTLSE